MDNIKYNLENGMIQNPGFSEEVGEKLHVDTTLGYVHLNIADMQRSVDFYQKALGFQIQKDEGGTTYLGAGKDDLLVLTEIPGAVQYPRRSGLDHFAILTPSRQALSRSLRNLIDTETAMQGGADHLVSEALYLADPDGNGIEIYRDRPRSEWQYDNGGLIMATDPLDYQGILREIKGEQGQWEGLESGTRLGHLHLHVANLDQATNFYEKVLGFDFLLNYMGSASFLSAGGYHHHIGLNTWNGIGAPPPPPDAAGLRYFSVHLVGEDERQKLIKRLEQANWSFEERGSSIFLRDPSQNAILFETAADD